MTDRNESTVVTLTQKGPEGEDMSARVEGTVVNLTIGTIETSATLRLPLSALERVEAFIAAVRADPAAAVRESVVIQEEATNG